MQPVTASARRYDNVTIFFHWATAMLVVTQWLGAQIIDWFPRGPLRVDARSVHITFGVLLAVLLARTLLHESRGGRDEGLLFDGQARRIYSGWPSSSMRFSTCTAMATSVARRASVRERSASPMTRLKRPISASTKAR